MVILSILVVGGNNNNNMRKSLSSRLIVLMKNGVKMYWYWYCIDWLDCFCFPSRHHPICHFFKSIRVTCGSLCLPCDARILP